jgi:HK97 family phage major capsid protein
VALYDNYISRSNATALIPESVSREIIQSVPESSAVMRFARRLPNMTSAQLRMPVLSGLITAGFVDGDTGLKPTSNVAWENKYINAAELACIVPIPEKVLDDVGYDVWGEVRPRIIEAMGLAFDRAVLYGTNAPADWPDGIVPDAVAAGQSITLGTNGDLYDDIMGEDGVISLVEEDGFMVTGHIAALSLRAKLRGLRDLQGQPIFMRTMQAATDYELDGVPVEFPKNGAVDPAEALLVSGDYNQLVYSIRQDVTYKLLTESVIMDASKAIIYNLPQQDMVALRVVMRLGWQVPNPITNVNTNSATRYPFAALLPAGG